MANPRREKIVNWLMDSPFCSVFDGFMNADFGDVRFGVLMLDAYGTCNSGGQASLGKSRSGIWFTMSALEA